MEFNYKGRDFHLTTIVDLEGTTWGIVAIYEMTYRYFKDNGQIIEVSSSDYDLASEKGEEVPSMDLRFIDYFWQDKDEEKELIEEAKILIDRYDQNEGKVSKLLRGLENHLRGLDLDSEMGLSELLEGNETTQEYLMEILETLVERITKK